MRTSLVPVFLLVWSLGNASADSTNCAPPPSMVSWWPGENNASDIVSSNLGIALNNVTYASGKVGYAFNLNGLGSHVRIADNPNLHLTNALSIEAWVYPTSHGAYREIVSKWDFVYQYQKSYTTGIHPDGRLYLNLCANGDETIGPYVYVLSTSSIPTNQWTHIAATYDGSVAAVYVNGIRENQAIYSAGVYPGTGDLGIGGVVGGAVVGDVGSPFAGQIDEVSIYSRALSMAEIRAIYSAATAQKCLASAAVALGLYPGLTITGPTNRTYTIEYTTNLAFSNSWTLLTTITLTQAPQLFIDQTVNVSGGTHPRRFYRVFPVQ